MLPERYFEKFISLIFLVGVGYGEARSSCKTDSMRQMKISNQEVIFLVSSRSLSLDE